MTCANSRLFLLSATFLNASMVLCAQTDQTAPLGRVKVIPPPVGIPFAIDNPKNAPEHSIRIVSEDEMTREDRDLLAGAESSIQEKAGVENLDFNDAGWTYRQLDCPALPKHLFVRFTHDDGPREMSMFSAAIPRDGNGRVHIIPIVRKGYSLFSPAPIGALTIAAFNRIRAEEDGGAEADWVGTGLCYAALTGANPEIASPETGEGKETAMTIAPTLMVTSQGGATIRFADVSVASKPMEWNMTFDPKGKLLKVTHSPAYVGHPGKPVASAVDDGEAKQ